MEMPTVYDNDILNIERALCPEDARSPVRVSSIVFPPVGFLPFSADGYGDYYGFYWPIGREKSPPLIAFSSHGAYSLIPEHGDLLDAARCQIAKEKENRLPDDFKAALAAANLPVPTIDIADVVAVDNHKRFLTLDPNSAFHNCAVADQLIAEGDIESAETKYRKAIDLLPGYCAAHFGLGYLLRRLRRQSEASIHLRRSLLSPLVFQGASFWADHKMPGQRFRYDWDRKALMWLQNIKDLNPSLHDDPFMNRINDLTLKSGVAESHDMDISLVVIDEFVRREQFLDAVYLWIVIGDRAAAETTPFRERHRITPRSFGNRLAQLLRLAGVERRAMLAESMLSLMDKPDGRHL